jgi:hypothetical protein
MSAFAEEFLFVNKIDNKWSETNSGVKQQWMGPTNWKSPVNYVDGSVHIQLVVKTKPSDKEVWMHLVHYQDGNHGESFIKDGVYFSKTGTFTKQLPGVSQWKYYGSIDYTRTFSYVRTHLKAADNNQLMRTGGCGNYCYPGNDLSKHVPVIADITVVVVAKGSTFSGWDNYPAGAVVSITDHAVKPQTRPLQYPAPNLLTISAPKAVYDIRGRLLENPICRYAEIGFLLRH